MASSSVVKSEAELLEAMRPQLGAYTGRLADFLPYCSIAGKVVVEVGADMGLTVSRGLIHLGASLVIAINPGFHNDLVAPDSRIVIIKKTLEDSGLGKSSVDIIIGISLVEHIDNLALFASTCLKILRPNGNLCIQGDPMWTAPNGHHTWLPHMPSGKQYFFNGPSSPWEPWEHLTYVNYQEAREALNRKSVPPLDADVIATSLFNGAQTARKSPSEIEDVFNSVFRGNVKTLKRPPVYKPNSYFVKAGHFYPERDLLCQDILIAAQK